MEIYIKEYFKIPRGIYIIIKRYIFHSVEICMFLHHRPTKIYDWKFAHFEIPLSKNHNQIYHNAIHSIFTFCGCVMQYPLLKFMIFPPDGNLLKTAFILICIIYKTSEQGSCRCLSVQRNQ